MMRSSLEKFLGQKTLPNWNETVLSARELLSLLRILFIPEKDIRQSRVYLMHIPPDFPVFWSDSLRQSRSEGPRLHFILPKKKWSKDLSFRSPLPFAEFLLVVLEHGAAMAIAAQKHSVSPALFRRSQEMFRVLSTIDPALLGELMGKLRRSVGKVADDFFELWNPAKESPHFFFRSLSLFLQEQLEQRFATEIQRRIRDGFAEMLPMELEGESFFLALNRIFRTFLHYDYLELQIPEASDFWPGRDSGWVWRDAEWTGQTGSIQLRMEKLVDSVRSGEPAIMETASSARWIRNPAYLKARKLQSGIVVPLPLRTRLPGWLKLFSCQRRLVTSQELSLLKFFCSVLAETLNRNRLYLRTQRLATIDGLTGLFNHRFFREQLRKEYRRARRYRSPLTLIMVDVDDFKQYNDTNGHLAGDQALITLASVIKRTVRDIDFVARYGGEEFALILPEVDARGGLIVAEKVRRAVEAQSFEGERRLKPHKKITISCGICSNAMAGGPEEMMELADQALYWVKHHGRNRCRLAQRVKDAKKT